MKLQETLKSIICEIASIEDITNYIKNKKKCIIYYDGDEPGGKGLRLLEPVALGYSKRNNLVVRAWEDEGASHRYYLGKKPIPGWRFFRLDKILSIKPSDENFETPRPNYNPNGDKSMNRVIINSKF
jgi:predicted DNA-binding transcriptional regulator YafY